ncbi:hypothetical protein HXX76_006663 [Chlamydomonas incerta]|uniref:Carboxylic ester hydrolase n=1 Tax=Chlamydomonas incerta TaxID=51695 RepID=A0A835TDR3_CHLIN|nr:hypothetical protein HXX76_006663 [Chlamydomonas incerta]|eukprot:KAG2436356.1 hypothetical protein HXX76_006663 [Chlamydomonas incerta]
MTLVLAHLQDDSEDCLSLNIWAPANASAGSRLPVRVFIHGGGFQQGTGSSGKFNGCRGAADGNVVMVTINYRLGILGFLALPELKDSTFNGTVGNWGLLDQQLALKWVKDNIAAFGGDPNKVVLYGQSAGAYSVLLHMVATGSKGLFSSAVAFSGSTDAMAVDFLPDAYAKGATTAGNLNCSAETAMSRGFSGVADCLRNGVDAETLVAVSYATFTTTVTYHVPCVDGVMFPKHPLVLTYEGQSAHVPIVLALEALDGVMEILSDVQGGGEPQSGKDLVELLRKFVSIPARFAKQVADQYDAGQFGGSWTAPAVLALTDAGYHCPALRDAINFADQGIPTRMMRIQMARPTYGCSLSLVFGGGLNPEPSVVSTYDAFHGYDVPFTFLLPYGGSELPCNFTDLERQQASFFSGMVSAVAATGAPLPARSASLTAPQLLNLTWPAWTVESQPMLDFNASSPALVEGIIELFPKCMIWNDILQFNIEFNTQRTDDLQSPPPPSVKPKTRAPPPARRSTRPPLWRRYGNMPAPARG